MADNTQDAINQLLAQTTVAPQPSFMGLQAPPSHTDLENLLGKLQQQHALSQMNEPTPGEFGYLHDAGKANFTQLGQGLGNLAQKPGVLSPAQAPQPAQAGPSPTQDPSLGPTNGAPPVTSAAGNPPVATNPQATTAGALAQGKQIYASLISSGQPEDQARLTVLKFLNNAGVPGADAALQAANDKVVSNAHLAGETAHNNAQAASDTNEIQRRQEETALGVRTRDQEDTRLGIEQQNADTAKQKQSFAQGQGDVDPDAVNGAVAKVLAGTMAMPSGAFMRTPLGQAIYKGVVSDPGYDGTNYLDRAKTVQQFTPGGTEGKALSAFNTAINHGQVLQDAADGLKNGDVQALNQVKNIFGKQFGGTPQVAVPLAAHLYSGEIQKTIIQNGGTEMERAAVESAFKDVNTPDQFKIAIATANSLLAGKVQVSRQNWETHVGQGKAAPDAFEQKFLSPAARKLVATDPGYQSQFPAQAAPGGATPPATDLAAQAQAEIARRAAAGK